MRQAVTGIVDRDLRVGNINVANMLQQKLGSVVVAFNRFIRNRRGEFKVGAAILIAGTVAVTIARRRVRQITLVDAMEERALVPTPRPRMIVSLPF